MSLLSCCAKWVEAELCCINPTSVLFGIGKEKLMQMLTIFKNHRHQLQCKQMLEKPFLWNWGKTLWNPLEGTQPRRPEVSDFFRYKMIQWFRSVVI